MSPTASASTPSSLQRPRASMPPRPPRAPRPATLRGPDTCWRPPPHLGRDQRGCDGRSPATPASRHHPRPDLAGEHVDGRAAAEKLRAHLRRHLGGVGADALRDDAVVGGADSTAHGPSSAPSRAADAAAGTATSSRRPRLPVGLVRSSWWARAAVMALASSAGCAMACRGCHGRSSGGRGGWLTSVVLAAGLWSSDHHQRGHGRGRGSRSPRGGQVDSRSPGGRTSWTRAAGVMAGPGGAEDGARPVERVGRPRSRVVERGRGRPPATAVRRLVDGLPGKSRSERRSRRSRRQRGAEPRRGRGGGDCRDRR